MKRVPFVLLALAGLTRAAFAAEAVKFSRDVLPILSEHCLSCHGQDESHRKGELRLDVREAALQKNAFVIGKPDESEIIKRIVSTDSEEVMPPPKSHKPTLKDSEIDTLKRWIKEGAAWGTHWAFELPVKVHSEGHPVDYFVQKKLDALSIPRAVEAPKHTQLRRLSFDLTGLPPSQEELRAFLNDTSPNATRDAVRRLLNSKHYGERMAMWWLDAARYADTDGFQSDATRSNWPWRDWVVQAFNQNMRYDQFTLEQFGGDLIANATKEQILATCFHRNHMTNGEGGRDPEESRVDYVIDRVNTVGTTWLGLTLGCAQCHSHKFDPISHSDYYSVSAFFNSIDEDGKAGTAAKPYLAYQSPLAQNALTESQALLEQCRPREASARNAAEIPFQSWLSLVRAETSQGWKSWSILRATSLEATEGTVLTQEADGSVYASGPNPNQDDYRFSAPFHANRITGLRLEVLPDPSHAGGRLSRGSSGEFILTDLKLQVRTRGNSQTRDVLLSDAAADVMADKKKNNNYGDIKDTLDDDPRNGWTTKGFDNTTAHTAVYALAEPLKLGPEDELLVELRQRSTLGDANIGKFRLSVTAEAGDAVHQTGATPREELAAVPENAETDPKLRAKLFGEFLADHRPYQEAKAALERASKQMSEAKLATGTLNVMVLSERKEPRPTFVLQRGVWDKHGKKVGPDVPPGISPWPENEERTRLGLARWIASPKNPLTARVAVNHLWQMLFGQGLVRTSEDFGLQGERPSHPELLDWLAVDFMEHGWDLKHTLELITTSATYRQSSAVTPALLAADPENRLLARGARFRLPSWMLRDAALRSSGLINDTLGGPPMRPYQPEGVWEEIFMGRFKYEPSDGSAQYRRTLYAFWRRSIAPTFLFDSAQRRSCEVRTGRTNTPLQALTLLNDGTYMEAARELAVQMLDLPEEHRFEHLYNAVLSRNPTSAEAGVLRRKLDTALAYYSSHATDAEKFLQFGQRPPKPGTDLRALAAHTLLASLTLNLDEAITHE